VGTNSIDFRRGFVAMVPLWPGCLSFAIAFAILARAGGFNFIATQALSMLVFAGSAQVTTVTLATSGASAVIIVLTAFVLNLRHVLYGLSLSQHLPPRARPPRWVLAFFMTDETYGMTVREALTTGRASATFLLGAGLSWYGSFSAGTLLGGLLGTLIPDPHTSGLDFIFPLLFLVLLLPLLHAWQQVLVAIVSAAVALGLSRIAPGGVTILIAGVGGAVFGMLLDSADKT
jgi:4-azaleucine resistance transporter AzlC